MTLKAKKLLQDFRRSGWKPGLDIRKNEAFAELSEACACDINGHAIVEEKPQISLGSGPTSFGVRDLFENLVVSRDGEPVGAAFVNEYLNPNVESPYTFSEAANIASVDSSAFSATMGQILVTRVLQPYEKEEYIVRKMFETINSPFMEEKWIGTTPPKDPNDDQLLTAEGDEYKMFGFGDQYVKTPITQKRGGIIGLTKEAIFFNRTGDITKQAAEVGDLLAYSEEWECLGCLIGTTTTFTEKRTIDAGEVVLDLYQQAAAGSGAGQLSFAHPNRQYNFVNDVPSNPLNDYANIEVCDQYFSVIVDPNRGRPIVVGKPFILAPHTKRINTARVLQAENVFKLTQQGVNTVGALLTNSPNPLGRIGMSVDQVAVSRLLQQALKSRLGLTDAQAREVWFYGDIGGSLGYVVNWPVTVVQAPPNTPSDFFQDIVLMWKASKRGRAVIQEPRKILRVNYRTQVSGV